MRKASIHGSTAAAIVASVRDQVSTGDLGEGAVLPPVRALAEQLGVNRNTVAAAYRSLVSAGIAQTRRRGGTIIAGLPALPRDGTTHDQLDLVDLASGNPDPALLPTLTVRTPRRPVLYGAPAMDGALAELAAAEFAKDGVQAPRIVCTHGAVDGVERVLAAHLTRGDAVAVEDPCFLAGLGTMRLNGYRTLPVPVDDHGMSAEGLRTALRAGARAVIVTSRAHNPTGAALTPDRAGELRALLAAAPEVLVIEDDHFSALSTRPFCRVAAPETARWAVVRSVAKFLGPDLRLAFVASDPGTARLLEARLNGSSAWVSHLLQQTVLELLTDPDTRALLDRARHRYAERAHALAAALARRGIAVRPSDPDGLSMWIPLPGPSTPVLAALAAHGWAVRPGEMFAADPAAPPHALRVTSAAITPEQAEAFAATLKTLWSGMAG